MRSLFFGVVTAALRGDLFDSRIKEVSALRTNNRRTDCDAEIPSYDLETWAADHPDGTLPDHPAIFTGYNTPEKYEGLNSFLEKNGDEVLTFFPEYGQPGGFGAQFPNHDVHDMPLKDAVRKWNETRSYSSTFNCKELKLCEKLLPRLGTPKLFDGPSSSINFLVGGPGTGLPLHEHGKTWQALLSGRKMWYLVPPGSMTLDLADKTNPFLMPVRAWSKHVDSLPLGKRPLKCVQHPGEVMYFPDRWFHGTLNLDDFQLAWGAKPEKRQEQNSSSSFMSISTHFPKSEVEQAELPYCLDMRFSSFERACKSDEKTAFAALEEPLKRLRNRSIEETTADGKDTFTHTLAFAYCALAAKADSLSEDVCPATARQGLTSRWREEAAKVSPDVFKTECEAK